MHVQALDKGQKDIIPQPSMDAWALGVMAYELLTGGPAFQILVDGPKQARPQSLPDRLSVQLLRTSISA